MTFNIAREQTAELENDQRNNICKAALITYCKPGPLRVVHFSSDCADSCKTGSTKKIEDKIREACKRAVVTAEGVEICCKRAPDFIAVFSKLTAEGILAALGQALFSLSVGMGVMLVYGSYLPANDNIFKTAMWITACDTLIALLAGLAIFPAVFSCGFDPAGGPGLVFCVLPNVFNSMGAAGTVFSVVFFLLLLVAALTSAISLLECLTACICEATAKPDGKPGMQRWQGALLFFLLTTALGAVFTLSFSHLSGVKIADLSLFDFIDRINSIYLPPICALGTTIFFGWVMPEADVRDEFTNHGTLRVRLYSAIRFLARYVAPVALLLVLITGIFMN